MHQSAGADLPLFLKQEDQKIHFIWEGSVFQNLKDNLDDILEVKIDLVEILYKSDDERVYEYHYL